MDASIFKNISSFLGGGWLSVGLSLILVGFLIWWRFKKHAINVEAARRKTEQDRIDAEKEARRRSENQSKTDAESRDKIDEFLGNSQDR